MKSSAKKINNELHNLLNSVISELQKRLIEDTSEIKWNPETIQNHYLDEETDENFLHLLQTLKYSFEKAKQDEDQLNERQIRYFIAILGNLLRGIYKHSKISQENISQLLKQLVTLGSTILPYLNNENKILKTDLCFELSYNYAFAITNSGDINKSEFSTAINEALNLSVNLPELQIYEIGLIQKITAACHSYIKLKKVDKLIPLNMLLFLLSEKAFTYMDNVIAYKKKETQKKNIYFQYFFYYVELLVLLSGAAPLLISKLQNKIQVILSQYNKSVLDEKMCLIILKKLMEILQDNIKTIDSGIGEFIMQVSGNFISDSTHDSHFKVLTQIREQSLSTIRELKKPNTGLKSEQEFKQIILDISQLIGNFDKYPIASKIQKAAQKAQFSCQQLSEKKASFQHQEFSPIIKFITSALEELFKIKNNHEVDIWKDKTFEICAKINKYFPIDIISHIKIIYYKSIRTFDNVQFDPVRQVFMEEIKVLTLSKNEHYLWKIHYFLLWKKEAIKYVTANEKYLGQRNYNLLISQMFNYTHIVLKDFHEFKDLTPDHLPLYHKLQSDYILTIMQMINTVRCYNEITFRKNLLNILSEIKQFIIESSHITMPEIQVKRIIQNIIVLITENTTYRNISDSSQILADIGLHLCSTQKTTALQIPTENLKSLRKEEKYEIGSSFSKSLNENLVTHHQLLEKFLKQEKVDCNLKRYKKTQGAIKILSKAKTQPTKVSELLPAINDIIYFFLENVLMFDTTKKMETKSVPFQKYFNLIDNIYRFYGQAPLFFDLMLNTQLCQLKYNLTQNCAPDKILYITQQITHLQSPANEKQYIKLKFLLEIMGRLQLYITLVIEENPEIGNLLLEKLLEFSIEKSQLIQVVTAGFCMIRKIDRKAIHVNSLLQGLNTVAISFNHFLAENHQRFLPKIERLIFALRDMVENNLELLEIPILATKPIVQLNFERLAKFPLSNFIIYEKIYAKFIHFSIQKYLQHQEQVKTKKDVDKHEQYRIETILQQKNKEIKELKNEIKKVQIEEKRALSQYQTEEQQLITHAKELERSQKTLRELEEKNHLRLNELAQTKKTETAIEESKYQQRLKQQMQSYEQDSRVLDNEIQENHIKLKELDNMITTTSAGLTESQKIHQTKAKQLTEIKEEELKDQTKLDMFHLRLQSLTHTLDLINEELKKADKLHNEYLFKIKEISPSPAEIITEQQQYHERNKKISDLENEIKTTLAAAKAEKDRQRSQLQFLTHEIRAAEQQPSSTSLTSQVRFEFTSSSQQTHITTGAFGIFYA